VTRPSFCTGVNNASVRNLSCNSHFGPGEAPQMRAKAASVAPKLEVITNAIAGASASVASAVVMFGGAILRCVGRNVRFLI